MPAFDFQLPAVSAGATVRHTWQALEDANPLDLTGLALVQEFRRSVLDAAPLFSAGTATGEIAVLDPTSGEFQVTLGPTQLGTLAVPTALSWRLYFVTGTGEQRTLGAGRLTYGFGSENAVTPPQPLSGYGLSLLLGDAAPSESSVTAATAVISTPTGLLAALANLLGGGVERSGGFAGSVVAGQLAADIAPDAGWLTSAGQVIRVRTTATRRVMGLAPNATTTLYLHADGTITATAGSDGLPVRTVTTNGTQATGFGTPAPALAFLLTAAGGRLAGALTLAADPTAALQAATKQYVDAGDSAAAQRSANLTDLASPAAALATLGGMPKAGGDFTGGVRFDGGKPWYDVSQHVDATGATDVSAALTTLQATAGANGVLYFPAGSYLFGANFTFTSPVVVAPGALLNPASSAIVVNINGPFAGPGLTKCFGSVTNANGVHFGANATDAIYPQWWGAKGDGTTDDRGPITGAYNAAPGSQGIVLPAGTYLINSSIGTITKPTVFRPGAMISPTTGNSPTFQAPIIAHPAQQIFATNTNVGFTASKANPQLSVKWWGAVGDGTTDDTTAITKANTLTTGCNIYFPQGTYVSNTSLTWGQNVEFGEGAIFQIATGRTMTFNGEIRAGRNKQIFQCVSTGKVVFGTGTAGEVPLKWWGLLPDDGTLGTATANAAAINTALLSGATDYSFGAGTFGITSISVPSNTRIYGAGKFLTSLKQRSQQVVFAGANVSKVLIEQLGVDGSGVSATSSTCHVNFTAGSDQIRVRDCWFHDTPIVATQRTFVVQFTDCLNVEVDRNDFSDIAGCAIYYHDSAGTSTGSFRCRSNFAYSKNQAYGTGDSFIQVQATTNAKKIPNRDIEITGNVGINVATNLTDHNNTQAGIDVYSAAHRVIVAHNIINGCGQYLALGEGISRRSLAAIRVSAVQECTVDSNVILCADLNSGIQVFCRGTYDTTLPVINSSVINNRIKVSAGASGGAQASVSVGIQVGNIGSPALSVDISHNSIVGVTPTTAVSVGYDFYGENLSGGDNKISLCNVGTGLVIEDGSLNCHFRGWTIQNDPANPQSGGPGISALCSGDTPTEALSIIPAITGGTFAITGRHPLTGVPVTVSGIAYNVSAAALQTALEAIYGAGNVLVSGTAPTWTITLPGWRFFPVSAMQVDATDSSGVTTLVGGTGDEDISLLPTSLGIGRFTLGHCLIEGFGTGILATRARHVTLEGNAIRRCQYGIYLTSVLRGIVANNRVVGITGTGADSNPLPNTWNYRINTCADLSLVGNYGEGAGGDAMNLNTCSDCRISGGDLREANQAAGTGVLLNLVGCTNVGVGGVLMRAGALANKPVSAIKVDAGSTGIDLSDGCDIQGTYASGVYALAGGGWTLPKPGAPSVVPAAISTRTITATVKLSDARGNPLARREAVRVWLADAQYGGESGTTPDGGSTIGGSGIALRTYAASLDWDVLPASDGSFTVAVTHSATHTYWLHVQDGAQIQAAQLVFP